MSKTAGPSKKQTERRSKKPKLADTYPSEEPSPVVEVKKRSCRILCSDLILTVPCFRLQIRRLIATLSVGSTQRADKAVLKRAAHQLSEFCKQG
jgi:hypothetical protein